MREEATYRDTSYLKKDEVCKDSKMLCTEQFRKYVTMYKLNKKKCCDPFKDHKKVIRNSLRPVNFDFAVQHNLITGTKICTKCYDKLSKTDISLVLPSQEEDIPQYESPAMIFEEEIDSEVSKLDQTLGNVIHFFSMIITHLDTEIFGAFLFKI